VLRNPLSFKPSADEEQYLSETGKLDCWSETVHNWIKNEQQKDKKKMIDDMTSPLLLLCSGILLSVIGFIIVPVTFILLVISIIFILIGGFFICVSCVNIVLYVKNIKK
jgi:hypothetical protein